MPSYRWKLQKQDHTGRWEHYLDLDGPCRPYINVDALAVEVKLSSMEDTFLMRSLIFRPGSPLRKLGEK